jgi:glycosyltransferase involved in cell wall biosynthesis
MEPFLHYIVPIFNAEKILRANIQILDNFLAVRLKKTYEIVLCDDGSTDRTPALAQELAGSRPSIRTIGYGVNRGRGYAIRYAAKTCSGCFLVYSDLDFPQTTKLDRIPEMTRLLEDCPVVIGSRFLPESRTRRIRGRRVVSWAHRLLVGLFFPRLGASDPDMGFKGFQRDTFRSIAPLSRMDRWSWDLEFLVIARRNGVGIAELPVDWEEKHEDYTTSVRLFHDSREEFLGLFSIRKNLARGLYDFEARSVRT